MGDQLIAVFGALVGLAAGVWVGFSLGRRYRLARARGPFWIASGVSVLLGMVVMFVGLVTSLPFVSGGGVGLMTGGLNGLRWGMGRLSDTPRKPRAAAPERSQGESRPEDHTPHPAT